MGAAGATAGLGPTGPETVAEAIARPNAGRVPYADEADADARSGSSRYRVVDDDNRSNKWLWLSALLALAILAVAGFLAFQFLSGPGPTPGPDQVEVPSFVDMPFADAERAAEAAGLQVERTAFQAAPDKAPDTVLSQDPAAGETVDRGSVVKLTLARGAETAIVPDLRLKTESEALTLIVQAGFIVGIRTEEFDPLVPIGSITSQDPRAGLSANKGIAINYVVSKGPEPSPSPSPTPTPTPTPEITPPPPTPPPTPTPPPPTAPPTPGPRNVGDYSCMTLAEATAAITGDGFVMGTTSGDTTGKVVAQDPPPGANRAFGTAINLTFENPPTSISCP
jgi:beta-lactam-binding protein with PASTA domain